MKKLSQTMDYYYQEIHPKIKLLEIQRKQIEKKIKRLIKFALFFSFYAIAAILYIAGFDFFWIVFANILIIIPSVIVYSHIVKNYTDNFKDEVIERIIKFLDSNLKFDKRGIFPKAHYIASGIFKTQFSTYRGNDLVMGVIDKTNIIFSDLYTSRITRGSKGNNEEETIFSGLFFMADFNKNFKGELYIFPDIAQSLLGGLGAILKEFNATHGKLIKLDSPQFEKKFVVYGNDQIIARYILSHSLMDRIIQLREKTGVNLYFSFKYGKIYIAIAYHKDQFEPNPFKSLDNFQPIREYIEVLSLVIGIVDDLKLNDRLWSKE